MPETAFRDLVPTDAGQNAGAPPAREGQSGKVGPGSAGQAESKVESFNCAISATIRLHHTSQRGHREAPRQSVVLERHGRN